MAPLSAYYDHKHDEHPIQLRSEADVDALFAQLRAEVTWPVLVQTYVSDDLSEQELSIGIDHARGRGVVRYAGPTAPKGLVSTGDAEGRRDPVLYYYMGSDTEFPVNAEVPLEVVRGALIDYLTTDGKCPTNVEWQQDGI